MNVWSKMITALRGGINEAGEVIVDSQALRILDQEVRDAAEELKQSKDSLAAIIARQKVAEERVSKIGEQIKEHEGYAVAALEKDNENLALEVAEKIAALESKLDTETATAKGYEESADQLRAAIADAERDIQRIKQQIDTVKATDSVQKAQAAVSERHSGSDSKLRNAKESLERIKERQELRAAQTKAAREIANTSDDQTLADKLSAEGITPQSHNAKEILERLKSK
ncbi:MAG: PspA/IM30 family protein [Pseudomonadota bacterium]